MVRQDFGAAAHLLERAVRGAPEPSSTFGSSSSARRRCSRRGEATTRSSARSPWRNGHRRRGDRVGELCRPAPGRHHPNVRRARGGDRAPGDRSRTEALPELLAAGDDVALYTVHHARGWAAFIRARVGHRRRGLRARSVHARRAGMPGELARVASALPPLRDDDGVRAPRVARAERALRRAGSAAAGLPRGGARDVRPVRRRAHDPRAVARRARRARRAASCSPRSPASSRRSSSCWRTIPRAERAGSRGLPRSSRNSGTRRSSRPPLACQARCALRSSTGSTRRKPGHARGEPRRERRRLQPDALAAGQCEGPGPPRRSCRGRGR